MVPPVYRKRGPAWRRPAVRQELAQLDPERDHQRMVHLLTAYEFPVDLVRALELALFHTYASPRVSGLLAHTHEFERHGQKRYDDTSLLIARFMQDGYDSPTGARAIAQMNRLHGHYRIGNAEYLFVLATFVTYPIDWLRRYGWRALTPSEERALFLFFREVGRRMHLTDLPTTLPDLRAFTADYEARYVRYADTNRRLADATVRIVQGWLPRPLRLLVRPTLCAVLAELPAGERLRSAFGYEPAPGWLRTAVKTALWLRKWPLRYVTFKPYPSLIENTTFRAYPTTLPAIDATGPDALLRPARREPS